MIDRQWIYDKEGLPTLQELSQIPRWALVAYAGHACRLVYRYIDSWIPNFPKDIKSIMQRILFFCEFVNPQGAALNLIDDVSRGYGFVNSIRSREPALATQANYLVSAFDYLAYCVECAANGNDNALLDNASLCAQSAVSLDPRLRNRLRFDFDDLLKAAISQQWNNDSVAPLSYMFAGNTRLFGQLLPFKQMLDLTEWPTASESKCLHDLKPAVLGISDVVFVSHAWITPNHPDPCNVKWQMLQKWCRELSNLHEEVLLLDASILDWKVQKDLFNRRAAIPLVTRCRENGHSLQRGGWQWGSDGGRISSIAAGNEIRAGENFLTWLKGSLSVVREAFFWIDSYSWPMPNHRVACEYCQAGLRALLPRLPELVQRSGSCCFVDAPNVKTHTRGWIILEKVADDLAKQSIVCLSSFSDRIAKIHRLAFECTTPEDGEAILIGYARMRAAKVVELQNKYFKNSSERIDPIPFVDKLLMPLGLEVELSKTQHPIVWQLEVLINLIRSYDFQNTCWGIGRGFHPNVASTAILIAERIASGILLRNAWKLGNKPLDKPEFDPCNLTLACLYVYLSRVDCNSEGVAWWIADAWSEFLGIDWPERRAGMRFVDRREETLRLVLEFVRHLEKGGSIECTMKDIGQNVPVGDTQIFTRSSDYEVWVDFPIEIATEVHKKKREANDANTKPDRNARELGASLEELGDIHRARGQSGDAEQALRLFEEALRIRQQIYEANPNCAQAARDLLISLERFSDITGSSEAPDSASRALELQSKALQLAMALHQANPASASDGQDAADSAIRISQKAHAAGQEELAGQCLTVCYSVLHTLVQNGCELKQNMANLYQQLQQTLGDGSQEDET